MSEDRYWDDETISLSAKQRIEMTCTAFEDAWRAGQRPAIEPLLQGAAEAERAVLLRELLLIEISLRRTQGETPTAEEYQTRFPDYALLIANVIKARVAMSERAGDETMPGDVVCPVAEPPQYAAGQVMGRYVIERELGHGSFGAVYLAKDQELLRPVAIKVPRRDRFKSSTQREEFFKEARTVAALKYSPIVAVYDIGRQEDGLPFVVMEYVEGHSLKELLKTQRPAPARAAEILAEVADAVDYAHRQGFVHCDLKPANILLDIAGNPHVVDFGLAIHESVQRARADECAGTLPYMAPEQVRRESHRLDGRTDIWALGVMLYEMLTGRRPFDGENRKQVGDEILHREPKPPRQVGADIPEELERICLKCLRKPIAERYTTARDLARDLRCWQRPAGRSKLRLPLVAAAMLVVIALFGDRLLGLLPGLREGQHNPPAASSAEPLKGTLDLRVWDPQNPARRDLTLRDPESLPLRPGDQIRITAELNRPAFLYVLWIDAQGKVSPVYPWAAGDWAQRPAEERPRDRLTLPADETQGWKVRPPYGTETVVLLAGDRPLPAEVDVERLLADVPSQRMLDPRRAIWFAAGRPITKAEDPERGIDLSESPPIDDPVLETQRVIQEKLGPHCVLHRAVSFASRE